MLTRIWKDPVWSKVIAAAIIGVSGAVLSYRLDWWPPITRGFRWFVTFVCSATSVPNWLLAILLVCAVPSLVVAALIIWGVTVSPRSSASGWQNYKHDEFFKLRWRWSYSTIDGAITQLHSFCPNCDYQVFPQNNWSGRTRIFFKCDSCGQQLGEFAETAEVLESKVTRLVQQKIRNNTFTSLE